MRLRLHVNNQPDGQGCDMTYAYLDAVHASGLAVAQGCRLIDDVYLVGDSSARLWRAYRDIRRAVAGTAHANPADLIEYGPPDLVVYLQTDNGEYRWRW